MYHPGTTQPNTNLASMQRTFYPKHCHYYGGGAGRDGFIIINNGGFNNIDKPNMGHTGVHQKMYNSNVANRQVTTPRKDASTFYYQSDGSGRDSYVLKNNGGLRMEYDVRASGDNIFRRSLRDSSEKKMIKYFKNADTSDITNYLNWESGTGRRQKSRQATIGKQVTDRLTSGSPNRESTLNYVIGTGEPG